MPVKRTTTPHVTWQVDAVDRINSMDDFEHYIVEIDPEVAVLWSQTSPVIRRLTRPNLVEMIKFINQSSPKQYFGKGHPDNGRMCHTFRVGKEFSRILYVVYKKVHCKLNEDQWMEFAMQALEQARRIGCPDDAMLAESTMPQTLTLRFWWD